MLTTGVRKCGMKEKHNYSMEKFGPRIKARREELGLSQRELSNRMNTSMRQIQRYESGEQEPSFERMLEIVEALNVPFLNLVDMDSELAEIFLGTRATTAIIPSTADPHILLQSISDRIDFLEKENKLLKDQLDAFR